MESRANYAAIGGFILVMIGIGLGFLGWLANFGQSERQSDVRVVFAGAVTGLSTGSAVLFNGIKIGEVRDLRLDEKDPRTVIGTIRVSRDIPLKTDTRAMLSYQGLTGAATLQLEGGSRNAPLLFDSIDNGRLPTMQAEISPFQDILESARNVLTRADNAMGAIDDFITENGPAFNRMVNNVETFSKALADNSGAISETLASISNAAVSARDIAESLKGATAKAETILGAVDPAHVTELVEDLTSSARRLDAVLARAETISTGIDPKIVNDMMTNIAEAAKTLDDTVGQANQVMSALDPKDVDDLVESLKTAADSIRSAGSRADGLLAAVDAEKVGTIVAAIDTTSRNLAEVSATFGGVSDRAKTALDAVNGVVGAIDPNKVRSTVDDVSGFAATLKTYQPQIDGILADTRNASASLSRLGDTIDGRRGDVDAMIGDARTLVEQLNGIATRTDGVVEKVGRYVDGDGQGLIKEATDAAKSIRIVADSLKTRVDPIAANVERFSGRGLDSLVAMADQGRQALARLDRILSSVEQNPQQFIFGGDRVPEYSSHRK